MTTFIGHEWIESERQSEPTGRQFGFFAETRGEAVHQCLYTERLKNGSAFVGPTGFVVYSGCRRIVFPKSKKEEA